MVIHIDTLLFQEDVSDKLEKDASSGGFEKIFEDDSYALFIKNETFSDGSKFALEYIKKSYKYNPLGESRLNILVLSKDCTTLEEYTSDKNDLSKFRIEYIKELTDLFVGYEKETQQKNSL